MVQRRPDRVLGAAEAAFWAACEREELHLPRCMGCGVLAWPIEPACTACGGTDFAWEMHSGRGTIFSWCTFEQDYYQGQFPMPWDCILVELEDGPLFIANPLDLSTDAMRIGLPVRVAFVECEDGHGRFRLPVFRADTHPTPDTQEAMP